jgi:protein involved in polysaccharide export with SLBB domain
LQALALAGGFKEFARTDSIVIIRVTARWYPSTTKLEGGKEMTGNVSLRPGDTVVVP